MLPHLSDGAHLDPDHLVIPEYWVNEAEVTARLAGRWDRGWLLGFRDITRSVDERTFIAAPIPRSAVGHKFPLMMPSTEPILAACLCSNLSSFALDYATRQKLGGASLTYFVIKQLPVLIPGIYATRPVWSGGVSLRDWLVPRVLELAYSAWDLEPFARDLGWNGPPFRWDPTRRALLRAELDAAFFTLYGLSRDDSSFIMDTFNVVRKYDEKTHGEYRTKRVILERYDAVAEATRSGKPYQTVLSPPPADPAVAHPDTRKAKRASGK